MSGARAAKLGDPEVLAAFTTAPVLKVLSTNEQHALARRARVVVLRAHDMLWREGDRASSFGVVLHGP